VKLGALCRSRCRRDRDCVTVKLAALVAVAASFVIQQVPEGRTTQLGG
jgi:hypothetical protein